MRGSQPLFQQSPDCELAGVLIHSRGRRARAGGARRPGNRVALVSGPVRTPSASHKGAGLTSKNPPWDGSSTLNLGDVWTSCFVEPFLCGGGCPSTFGQTRSSELGRGPHASQTPPFTLWCSQDQQCHFLPPRFVT